MSTSKDKDGNGVDQNMEGEVWSWTYQVRDGVSGLQITRNFETAFRQAGVTIDFKADGDKIVAHKGNKYCQIQTGTVSYYQTVVEVKEMQQEVSADASSLSDELTKTGHVAVYGIHFETGKSAILLDSEGTLQEIIKFTTSDTATNLRVEDHTNNVGVPVANQALSERRAQAVVAWLVAHGVPAARLSSQPIADDSTEAGRAKNRRVELVKQ
jgi:outer membrane protein OmpA-like peptidoglycan-associated protein